MKPSSPRSLLLALLTLCLLLEIGCGAQEKAPSPDANPPDSASTDKKKNSSNWDFGTKDTLRLFHTLDPLSIMDRLFDQPKYDSLGYALWRPNFNERLQFNVSEDGLCHTRIDTLMLWKDRDQRQCAVLVFSTEHFGYSTANHDSMEITECHFCGAAIGAALLFQQDDGQWRLYWFEKYFTSIGIWGEYSKDRHYGAWISLRQIGDQWTCFSIRDMISFQSGEFWSYEYWYSIEEHEIGGFPGPKLQPIFDFAWIHGYYDWETEVEHEETSEVRLLPKPKACWDLDLITHRESGDTVTHFVFDEGSTRYVLRE